MKGTLVYNMKLGKKKGSISLCSDSTGNMCVGHLRSFATVHVPVNDGESTARIDFGLQIHLSQWVNSQIGNGSGLVTKLCLAFATSWAVAHQTSLSLGFSRQEYWSGLPFPSPGDLPDPGIEPGCPTL